MQNERKKILEGNDLFTSLAWFKKKRIQFKNINSQGLMNCMSIVWKKKKKQTSIQNWPAGWGYEWDENKHLFFPPNFKLFILYWGTAD